MDGVPYATPGPPTPGRSRSAGSSGGSTVTAIDPVAIAVRSFPDQTEALLTTGRKQAFGRHVTAISGPESSTGHHMTRHMRHHTRPVAEAGSCPSARTVRIPRTAA